MASTAGEMINYYMCEEFIQSYSDNDILERFAIENDLNITLDEINEDDLEEFTQMMYEEYKEERVESWH